MLQLKKTRLISLLWEQAGSEGSKIIAACLASGVTQGLAVFAVLQGLEQHSQDGIKFHTFLLFLISLGSFYYLFRYITGRTAVVALRGVMEWRMRIATKLRAISFGEYEKLDKDRLQAALLDGREMVVEAARMLVASAANSIMIVVTFMKMFTVSLSGAIAVFIIMALGLLVFLRLVGSVQALMGPAMQADFKFSANLKDLQQGLQQLKLHKPKTTDLFRDQIIPSLDSASEARKATEQRHALGISFFAMFNLLILGIILFLMPRLIGLDASSTSEILVLSMFSLGPLMSLVAFVPLLSKVEMSLKELSDIEAELDDKAEPFEQEAASVRWQHPAPVVPEFVSLQMRNVQFDYVDKNGAHQFCINIEDFHLNRGELVFIRGGNGSGKSTFMKVLTGVYAPHSGTISVNDIPLSHMDIEAYRNLFTIVPTDYHIFSSPIGLDVSARRMQKVLQTMRIDKKVSLDADGGFSTLDLSAGQRKRLALACALLEERDVYLFDEVAADFDPAFRYFFYEDLLPQIVRDGGTVLAISHDDRYFHVADRVLTMEEGLLSIDQGVSDEVV